MFPLDRFIAPVSDRLASYDRAPEGPDPFSDPRPLIETLQRWMQQPQTQHEERQRAADRIEDAWRRQTPTLDLLGVNVSTLPRLRGFGHLKSLHLNARTLEHFPEIEAPQLTVLWLSGTCNRNLAACSLPPAWNARFREGSLRVRGDSFLLAASRARAPWTSDESYHRRVRRLEASGWGLNRCVDCHIPYHPAIRHRNVRPCTTHGPQSAPGRASGQVTRP